MLSTIAASNQIVAGYTLIERIGAGGYGEVWRAAAPGGLSKAVKIVYGVFGDVRADRELKALDRIKEVRHPFLLSLERIEVIDHRLVIVTELAEMSLADRFQQCRLAGQAGIPRKELLSHLRDAADALDFMQERYSLQHLDIKPGNLLLVGGRLKVADFGLVKDLHEVAVSQLDGMTPAYAAPELFNGAPSERSDQYSLAIVYQEMLTGDMPFVARSAAEWARVHMSPTRRPKLDSLAVEHRRHVDRALARLPIDRFANCSEFVAALCGQEPASPAREAEAPAQSPSDARYFGWSDVPGAPVAPQPTASHNDRTMQVPVGKSNANADALSHATTKRAGLSSEFCDSKTLDPRKSPPTVVKLPPAEYRAEKWRPAPTLVIGIGGTGCRVVGRWRERLAQRFGSPAECPAFSSLVVDTDQAELNDAVHARQWITAKDAVLQQLRSTQDYREESQELLRWLSRRWLYNIPADRKTQGWRPLGRLAFVDHGKQFLKLVRERLDEIVGATALEKSAGAVGREFQAAPRVVVVASICGGSGSGMALDAGYAVRQALRDAGFDKSRTLGMLTVSSPRDNSLRELALANSYACLSELHCYATSPTGYPGDELCGLRPTPPGMLPFDDAYVVHLGQGQTENDFSAQCHLAAEYLFLDVATPVGQMLEACRVEPDEAETGAARAPSVRTCRLLPLTFPEPDLTAAILPRLHKEVAAQYRGERPAAMLARSLPALGLGASDEARLAAMERVNQAMRQRVRSDLMRFAGALVAQAQLEGGRAPAAIDPSLSELRQTLFAWRDETSIPPSNRYLASDEGYSATLIAAFQEWAEKSVPELAKWVAATALEEVMEETVSHRLQATTGLEGLRTLPARASRVAHDELSRWLQTSDITQWVVHALRDSKHAILCWRNFLKQSEPLALGAGGERRLAIVAPESPTNAVVQEMLHHGFSEPTAVVLSPSPVVWLLQEAQNIPVLQLADHLVGGLDIYREAASRLHTRVDVDWQRYCGAC